MKRTLLDITQKISRKVNRVILTPINMDDYTYWIWEARGYRFVSVLDEIELRNTHEKLFINVNTQYVSNIDYIVEDGENGLIFKFIKSQFEFELDLEDYIEVKGNIEKYA